MPRLLGIRAAGPALAIAAALVVAVVASPAPAAELLLYSSRHYPKEPAFDAFTKKTGIALRSSTRVTPSSSSGSRPRATAPRPTS